MLYSIIDKILYTFILSTAITLAPVATVNSPYFYDGDFVLSVAPGIHDEPFDLVVSIPSIPNATIYWTIDGTIPWGGTDRFKERGDHTIQVSGSIPESGKITVHDRSGYWRYAILAAHSELWPSRRDVIPAEGAEILQGTAFRFRGFVDGEAVTETITVTYVVAPNAAEQFNNRPVIAVTAPYEDLIYIYYNIDLTTRRRTFNYEYFELIENEYIRFLNLPGSTSLGGKGSRHAAQRTFNVHLARGQLDSIVDHSVFCGLYELYRFRLWNGGSNFGYDLTRDAFVQSASAELNVPFSDNNLAIKFINGEFWGFTNMREHTSNRYFIHTRLGIDIDNIAVMDRNHGPSGFTDLVAEGDEAIVLELHAELVMFLRSNDMTSDYARERLFNEFFCQYNFMDYLIANTFFNNHDWPYNNVRYFRAIVPELNSQNPYNDGRWRFILHDMDFAPHRTSSRRYLRSNFSTLYELHPRVNRHRLWFNYAFLVLNNPTFAEQFRERAIYVLDNHYTQEQLLAYHDEFIMKYTPLLPKMYNRFAVRGTVDASIDHFNFRTQQLRTFIINREYYYRQQLDELVERVR